MSKKLLALLVAVSTCCAFGCSDDDSDSCKMGEKRCDGNMTQTCVKGNWSKGTPCVDGCDKATGVCKEKAPETGACETAGEKRCSGTQLQECKNGNWSKLKDCKDSCDEAKKECGGGNGPIPGNECAPGVTNKDCTPACSADHATGYYWNSRTNEIGSKPCPNKDCYIDGTSVKCRTVETCDKNSKKKTCVDENTVSFCNKNGEVQTQTCNSCTLNADSTYYCCNGDNSKCESTDEKCEEGGTEYCLKHCLDDGSRGYYYKQGKVEVVVCAKNDCIINSKNYVVCESEDNAGGGTGAGEACDKATTNPVCNEAVDKVTYCSSSNELKEKDCPQCYVNGGVFWCNGDQDLTNCVIGGTSKCKGNCVSDTLGYIWNKDENMVKEYTCTAPKKCTDNGAGYLSCK